MVELVLGQLEREAGAGLGGEGDGVGDRLVDGAGSNARQVVVGQIGERGGAGMEAFEGFAGPPVQPCPPQAREVVVQGVPHEGVGEAEPAGRLRVLHDDPHEKGEFDQVEGEFGVDPGLGHPGTEIEAPPAVEDLHRSEHPELHAAPPRKEPMLGDGP